MNNFYHWRYNQLVNEYQLLKQLTYSNQQKSKKLKHEMKQLEKERKKLEELINKFLSTNQHSPSVDFTINNVKINQIQSGAAFNLGEKIFNYTNSDMDMDLGPNSMNVGDYNQMKHCADDNIKVKLPPPSMDEEV
ncbi:hypothetical protein [Bacillus taeanensis]|uniref:Uncharacterized protein n=1 Tax=Bacillus taeanensis TaxID=273032 RepID=A0A366XX10_9BACI|nr:hypothetical protein [Bacillus taeanensis]RBW70176.1 hypothetical protein DS031_08285 [Bacillus taeanensis]